MSTINFDFSSFRMSEGYRNTVRTRNVVREQLRKIDELDQEIRGTSPVIFYTHWILTHLLKAQSHVIVNAREEEGGRILMKFVERSNAELADVKHPVAMLKDAACFNRLIQCGMDRAKNADTEGGRFSTAQYVINTVEKYCVRSLNHSQDDDVEIDWRKIDQHAAAFFDYTPSVHFMSHPLGKDIQPKVRKQAVRQKRRQVEETTPLLGSDSNSDKRNSEKRQRQIRGKIESWGREYEMRFAELFFNPDSFGETIENLFVCSSLVNQNILALDKDPVKGFTVARRVDQQSAASENQEPKRHVVKFDMEAFEKLRSE
eukprot:756638-Hanusia_phi.AAC.4